MTPLRSQILAMLDEVTDAGMKAHVRHVVDQIVATYRTNDVAGRVALCAPDILFVDPVGLPEIHGRDALARFFNDCVDQGWQFRMHVDDLIVCSNEALMTWTVDAERADCGGARLQATNMLAFDAEGLLSSWRVIIDDTRVTAHG